jgi:hypothetical protein
MKLNVVLNLGMGHFGMDIYVFTKSHSHFISECIEFLRPRFVLCLNLCEDWHGKDRDTVGSRKFRR